LLLTYNLTYISSRTCRSYLGPKNGPKLGQNVKNSNFQKKLTVKSAYFFKLSSRIFVNFFLTFLA
jgi:hypothetical protein